jgi:hypothetical protein
MNDPRLASADDLIDFLFLHNPVAQFMREAWPVLLKMNPPKMEAPTAVPDLKIDSHYVPLAKQLKT